MTPDPTLFEPIPPPRRRGRVRSALETDVTAARGTGVELAAAGVAALRTLADNIDSLDYALRFNPKPYDRVPVATLVHEFGETYDRVFAAVRSDADPLTRALAEFTAAEARNPEGIGAD
jgi:hypothetical protein